MRDFASTALIDTTGRYRYSLVRHLTAQPKPRLRVLWVMLNPSTADARVDDPTIRRCIDFSCRWGFDELEAVNLYALRATDPTELRFHGDPVGPRNDLVLAEAMDRAQHTIFAWGFRGGPSKRATYVAELARISGIHPGCLGITTKRQPRHPLYVPRDSRVIPWGTA